MKKSNKLLISALSVLIATVLFSIPVSFITEQITSASNDSAVIQNAIAENSNEVDGYLFTIIEDEPVALAANPFETSSTGHVGTVVCVSLISMLGIAYISWYTMVRRNIFNYSSVVPDYEIKALIPAKAFLHPVELSAAEYEVQYRAAKKCI